MPELKWKALLWMLVRDGRIIKIKKREVSLARSRRAHPLRKGATKVMTERSSKRENDGPVPYATNHGSTRRRHQRVSGPVGGAPSPTARPIDSFDAEGSASAPGSFCSVYCPPPPCTLSIERNTHTRHMRENKHRGI